MNEKVFASTKGDGMKTRRQRVTLVGLAVVIALAAVAAATASRTRPQASKDFPAATQALITQAKQEGKLTFLSALPGGRRLLTAWQDDFNKYYGLSSRFTNVSAFSIPTTVDQVVTTLKANQPSPTDLFVGSQTHILLLDEARALQPIDINASPDITNKKWIQGRVGPVVKVRTKIVKRVNGKRKVTYAMRPVKSQAGTAVPFYVRLPGITYNTRKFGNNPPDSYSDLLTLNARIAGTPYGSSFADLASPEVWGVKRTLDFANKFADKISGLIACGNENRVGSGEFDVMAPDCGSSAAAQVARTGAPVASAFPRDAPFVAWFWAGVPAHAQNPATAKLFVNYLLTKGAQDILWSFELSDFNKLKGSHSAEQIAGITGSRKFKQLIQIDVNFSERNGGPQTDSIRDQVQAILAKKG